MKRIIFTLCVLIAFATLANAGEMYSCTDRDGNSIITSSPQDGMENCVLKDSYRDPSPYEQAQQEREKDILKAQNEKREERETDQREKEENQKKIMESRERQASDFEFEARGSKPEEIKNCLLANAAKVRRGEPTSDCYGIAAAKSAANAKNKRECEDACSQENLYCIGSCMGGVSCMNMCSSSQFRCLSKCN